MFYLVGIFRTSNLEDRISSNHERIAPRRQGGPRIYRIFAKKGQVVRNIQRLLLIKESQICQPTEFSTFLCMDTHRQVWLSLLWGHCSFLLGVCSSALYLWCLMEGLNILGAQLTFWMKEVEAGWVLNFPCHVTGPGWILCSPP